MVTKGGSQINLAYLPNLLIHGYQGIRLIMIWYSQNANA
nr:MAG TPA: hypothetical protein [Caudoviricetes sp.]